MIKEGKMFDIAVLDKFRDETLSDVSEVDPEVKKAWIIFVSDLCQCVSYQWTEYLKKIKKKCNIQRNVDDI